MYSLPPVAIAALEPIYKCTICAYELRVAWIDQHTKQDDPSTQWPEPSSGKRASSAIVTDYIVSEQICH
jgi:hypothetical protein